MVFLTLKGAAKAISVANFFKQIKIFKTIYNQILGVLDNITKEKNGANF